MAVVWAKQSRR